MVRKLEEATKGQASNKLWFLHRAGRITASQFKAVCHTNPIMPSQSLIKKICYPEAMKFSNEATKLVWLLISVINITLSTTLLYQLYICLGGEWNMKTLP